VYPYCSTRYDVPYVYTIEFVESRMGISSQESTHIISIIGKRLSAEELTVLCNVVLSWD
jgi:hypothetical protein